MKARTGLALALAAALLLAAGISVWRSATAPKSYTVTWWDVFDTVTVLTGYADSEAQWQAQADAVHEDLLRYHRLFDIYEHYDGVTNLADLNELAGQGPVAVDAELMALLQFGKQAYEVTGGACNLAAGSVLALWHDAREAAEAGSPALPDADALALAAEHTAIDDLVLDPAAMTVTFADPDLRLDAGAIAKGWALEQTARAAEARGLTRALLNAGGSVRASGTTPDGSLWTAGVQDPDGDGMLCAVPLQSGQSLVISGDYQRYFTLDGVRYHHLIDLTTLQPARYCRSAAVLCTDAGLGDALSTGLFCLPADEGTALAAGLENVQAMWVENDGTLLYTDGWPAAPAL